jgi:hypothetical protein
MKLGIFFGCPFPELPRKYYSTETGKNKNNHGVPNEKCRLNSS